jgi:hypothetical protein
MALQNLKKDGTIHSPRRGTKGEEVRIAKMWLPLTVPQFHGSGALRPRLCLSVARPVPSGQPKLRSPCRYLHRPWSQRKPSWQLLCIDCRRSFFEGFDVVRGNVTALQ